MTKNIEFRKGRGKDKKKRKSRGKAVGIALGAGAAVAGAAALAARNKGRKKIGSGTKALPGTAGGRMKSASPNSLRNRVKMTAQNKRSVKASRGTKGPTSFGSDVAAMNKRADSRTTEIRRLRNRK